MADVVGGVVARLVAQAEAWETRASETRVLAPASDAPAALGLAARELRALAAAVDADTATLSAEQYAALHRTTPQSVRRWCATGQIPGGHWNAATRAWEIPRGAERVVVRTPRRLRVAA